MADNKLGASPGSIRDQRAAVKVFAKEQAPFKTEYEGQMEIKRGQ